MKVHVSLASISTVSFVMGILVAANLEQTGLKEGSYVKRFFIETFELDTLKGILKQILDKYGTNPAEDDCIQMAKTLITDPAQTPAIQLICHTFHQLLSELPVPHNHTTQTTTTSTTTV